MITVSNLGMQFGGQWLFQHVDLQFLPGNCYGIIGANGAGKSTFLRILTGELESTNGSVTIDPTKRLSVLKQDQNAYDDFTVMDTVIMGNQHLYDVDEGKGRHLRKARLYRCGRPPGRRPGGGIRRAGRLGGGIRRLPDSAGPGHRHGAAL